METFPACCITYAELADLDAFVRRFGADVVPAGEVTAREAFRQPAERRLVVDAVGGWAVGVEPYGYQGSRPEALRALSADGRVVSVYWNVNARMAINYAAGGQVLASYDPITGNRRGREPAVLDPYTEGLSFGGDGQAAALRVAERVTGVRLGPEWLDEPHRAYVITPLPEDLVPDGYHDHPAVVDDELRALIDRPAPDALPRIAALAAELIVRHTGVGVEPLVAEALRALRDGRPARPGLRAELQALAEEYRRRWREASESPGDGQLVNQIFWRRNAIRAVEAALDPDPARAAWNACWIGGNAVGGNFDDQLRLVVLTRLADRAAGRR